MIAALPFMTLGFKGIDVGGQCCCRFLPALRMEGEYVYDCSASCHDPQLQRYRCGLYCGQCYCRLLPALRMEGEYFYDRSASLISYAHHDPRLQRYGCGRYYGQCYCRLIPTLRMGGEHFYDCSGPSHDLQLQGIDVVGAMVSADAVYYMQCGWKANTSMSAALHFMTLGFKGIEVVGTVVSPAAVVITCNTDGK